VAPRTLIRNALIVTGDGQREPFAGNALIEGDRLALLGAVPPSAANAERVIDADGLVLAPGFVDMHNHGALGGTRIGARGLPVACENALLGGVTKRICGTDGLSPAPVAEEGWREYAAFLGPVDGTIEEDWPWRSVEQFWTWWRGRSVTDMGLHLGHSAVRRAVMGNAPRRAQPSELSAMAEAVRREAPATLGFSTGLIYNPAVFADRAELAALIRAFNAVKPGAFFPHIRNESDAILEAMREAVEAAVEGGGAYCNEHMKIAGPRNFDKIGQVDALLNDVAASVPAMENMYLYTAGSTTGEAIFPPEFRGGTREDLARHLASPSSRRAIWEWMRSGSARWENFYSFCGGWQGIQIAGVKPGVGDAFLGKRLADVARARGAADPAGFAALEAVADFFLENDLRITIISHHGDEPTVQRLFRRPSMAICTDGLMPGPGQKPHPRSLGTFPKALRTARELGIPLREIVYRMTELPCRFLHLESPVLDPGADASLVLFDPERVGERNTYEEPFIPPEGIERVWVHGQLVLERGAFHVPRPFPGRVLRAVAGR
jgi:N-acyl-D-amino-acid deacylase